VTDALADSAIVSQHLTFRRNVLFLINGEVLRPRDRRCPPLDPRRLTVADLMIESIADTGFISDVRLKGHGGSDERLARYGDHALLVTGALIQVPEILDLLMHNLEVTAESGSQSDLRDLSVRIGDWWRRNRARVRWDVDRSAFVLALKR
jgi:hypothetical protein